MVDYHILLHDLIEIEMAHVAADGHPQRVADEKYGVVILQKSFVLRKDGTLGGLIDICLQLGHPALSGVAEDLIQHLQVFEVERFGEFVRPEHAPDGLHHPDYYRQGVCVEYSSHGGLKDNPPDAELQ